LPSLDIPELDIAGVSSAWRRSVEAACPEHLPLAMRLFDRIEPGRWTLEWNLPWWLGLAFGLDEDEATELVLGTVLGLASVRLQDDLADGDVPASERAAAIDLSATLYELALAPYRSRFPPSSRFWAHLATTMAAWRAATDGAAPGDTGTHHELDDTHGRLAIRGAPLKVPAFAICLLTDQMDAYPVLDRGLDHALTALVLYDHFGDWQADLAAGRWNAFVAAASGLPQDPASRDRVRAAVQLALLRGGAVKTYVNRVTTELELAATLFDLLGLTPAVAHFRSSASSIEAQGVAWQGQYDDLAEQAGRLLYPPIRDRSRDALAASVAPGV
jgi:hypothetical protein